MTTDKIECMELSDKAEYINPSDKPRTSREISNANLIPFQPGYCGNPLGRPKKDACITSLVKDILDKKEAKSGLTYAQLIAEAMVKQALKDPQILKELLNRTEGKVVDSVDIQGTNVTITYELTKE